MKKPMLLPMPPHHAPRSGTTAGLLVAAGLAAAAATAAHATPPTPTAAPTDEIAHTVQAGDTLEGLARAYLSAPQQWPLLQARNKVANPRRLQPGSVVWIPVRLQPQESATVAFVHGPVTAHTAPGGAPVAVAQGGKLSEGTALHVGPDGFVTIKLADGTVVRVQAQSDLQLRQLRRRGRAGNLQSVLEMQRGTVETSVPPSAESTRRFELRTPQAVTSVRGTRFSVATSDTGHTTAAVLQGSVAVQARPGDTAQATPTALLAPGQGLAVAADGTVGTPRPLLPAPDTSGVPATLGDANLLAIDLPAPTGAAGYEAQVAQDADFTQVLRHGRFTDGRLRWQALDDGHYHLAVRALDRDGVPGIPAVQPLTVKTRPVAPLHQQPAPGAIVAQGQGSLQCTQVPGVRWYRVQVANDAGFTQPLVDEQRLAECRLPVTTLPVGAYFWRMASLLELPNGQADQGPFAPPQQFSVAQRPAALSLQALQASSQNATARLHWPGQPGQRFRLQLAPVADTAFQQPTLDTVLDAPEWTASTLATGEYLVRIQVLDPTGLVSDFSPARQFQVSTGVRSGSGLPVSTPSGQTLERP